LDDGDDPWPNPASIRLDPDGRIRDAGAVAAAMLGYEPMALAGRTLGDLAAQGWRDAAEVASRRVRYGSTEDFSLLLRGRSGRLSLIEMAARPSTAQPGGSDAVVLEWANGRARPAAHAAAPGQLRGLAISLMQRREGERLNVSQRLHDDLAPTLAMAKYLVEDAAQRSARGEYGDAGELLGQAAVSLRHVIAELSNISNALRPRLLDDLGLLPALEWYGRGFEEAHPGITMLRLLSAPERSVPDELKVDVFRVVQEALGNVARHSQASIVRLSLVEEDGELRLAIEDNGRGFDAAFAFQSSQPAVGLLSMRKRIRATGGRFTLESRPQRGTRVAGAWTIGTGPLSGRVLTENGDPSYYPKSVARNQIRE
jgi:two-component system NarL family sensor kinase